jgi:hypothetical protein
MVERLRQLFLLQASALSVTVALESSHGSYTYATAVFEDVRSSWRSFRATLTADTTDPNACLALRLEVLVHLCLSCSLAAEC